MADDQEQPVAEDKKESKPRMSFFPKLLLWALVIAFGYLYLGSLERDQGDGDKPATAAQATAPAAPAQPAQDAQPAPPTETEPTPAAGTAATGSDAGAVWPAQPQPQPAASASAPAAPQTAQQPAEDATEPGERDVSKTEAEAFAQALMDKEGAAQTATPTELGPQPEPPDQPKASGQAPAPQAEATQSPTLPLPPPQQTSAATPAQPEEAPASTGDDTAAAGVEPGVGQVMPPRPLSARERVYQRARIAAQYRELRRQAIEDARQRWYETHPMPGPMPVPGYYGTPGLPAPGYPAAGPSQGQASE